MRLDHLWHNFQKQTRLGRLCRALMGARCKDRPAFHSLVNISDFPGGNGGGATPVPISNTEVKPSSGDGTAWATAWESSTLPGISSKRGSRLRIAGPSFFYVRPEDRRVAGSLRLFPQKKVKLPAANPFDKPCDRPYNTVCLTDWPV